MVSIWDKSDADTAKTWHSNGLELCYMSLLKEQIADKGKSGPRGRVNCTGFLDEVINSIYSGDI